MRITPPWLIALVVSGISSQVTFAQSRLLGPQSVPLVAATPLSTAGIAKLLERVPPIHRDLVAKVVTKPTLAATYHEDPFTAHPAVYEWLLEHPDRTALAWQRLKIPCVDILDVGGGKFSWADEQGSELVWQVVAKSPGFLVWYATGKVKAATLLPMVPVKAVAIVDYPAIPTTTVGVAMYRPKVSVHFLSESRAANLVLRVAGPSAPKLAEDGAEQLMFFFSGIAGHIFKHPEQIGPLLAANPKSTP